MSGEKTEAPTPRALADARKEGRVARSQELNTAASLLATVWLLRGPGGQMVEAMREILDDSLHSLPNAELTGASLRNQILLDGTRLLPSVGMLLGGFMVVGILVSVSQTGLMWAQKKLGFKFNALNPINGLKRIFSKQGLVEFVKASFKLLLVGWVAYSFLRSRVDDLLTLGQTDFTSAMSLWVDLAMTLIMRVGSAYLLIALADYAYQRWMFINSMKMSKEEIKEEAKRNEGDPLIKGRIRAQQRRMARMRMMANVPKADVVITNPTHLAVAVQYKAEEMGAPRVVAKGSNQVAHRIVEVARENGVPVMQNIPVARALYRTVEIDEEIPPELYTALAEVLAYVYRLHRPAQTPARA